MAGKKPIDFNRTLNPEQLQAVTHGDGPQLVLAGAGSGKTRVITYRIAWLVRERGVDPQQISAVTFTNKAASEMKERIETLLELYPLPTFVGTFHRFALRMLRIYGERVSLRRDFAILDGGDQLNLVKQALKDEKLDEKSFRPQSVLAAISGAKNRLVGPAEYEREAGDFFRRRVAAVYRRYQGALREASAVDFDDMIALAVRLLAEHDDVRQRVQFRTRYLLIDEFQDTNHAQLSLIRQLTGAAGNLTAVGDEDQGIYRWRGAELDNILNFEASFPGATVRKLERNYRSTQNILDAAGAVVANNEGRRGKRLWTDAGAGSKVTLYRAHDERDEARWAVNVLRAQERDFPLAGMAILVRTNSQTRSFEEELLRRGIAYLLVGGTRFYERAEIKDLIAYLRFLRNPRDDYSLGRIINRPPRGIGKSTLELLRDLAARHRRPLWDELAADQLDAIPGRGAQALRRFRDQLAPVVEAARELSLPNLLHRLLDATSYTDLYDKHEEDGQARLENIDELLSAAQEFVEAHAFANEEEDLLTAFLDHVALVSDTDSLKSQQGVSLMTLHSAKGLEFPVVIVGGLEEKLLPHFNAFQPEDLEEERRLLYVGMTRAEKKLFLTTCQRRMIAGTYQDQEASRFLSEIPAQYLEVEQSPELFRRAGAPRRDEGNVYAFFGKPPVERGGTAPSPEPAPSRALDYSTTQKPTWEEELPSGSRLRRGSRVRHATLGQGQVLTIEGSGDDMRLTIYFDGQGRRKLMAKYAKLEVV